MQSLAPNGSFGRVHRQDPILIRFVAHAVRRIRTKWKVRGLDGRRKLVTIAKMRVILWFITCFYRDAAYTRVVIIMAFCGQGFSNKSPHNCHCWAISSRYWNPMPKTSKFSQIRFEDRRINCVNGVLKGWRTQDGWVNEKCTKFTNVINWRRYPAGR